MQQGRTFRFLILGSLGLVAAGCASSPQPSAVTPPALPAPAAAAAGATERAMAEAERYLAERQFAKAADAYATVLRADPRSRSARIGAAEAYLGLGQGKLALGILDDLEHRAEDEAAILQAKGTAHALLGDDDPAEAYLNRAVALDPRLWQAWTNLGRIHDRRRDWPKADAAYGQALQVTPQSAIVHNNFGVSLLLRGDHAGAARHFARALALSPRFGPAIDNLAFATALQGRYEAALANVPEDRLPATLNNIGVAALTRGDRDVAADYFGRALRTSPRHFAMAAENLRWLKYADTASP